MYIFIKTHPTDSFVLNNNLNSILTKLGLVIFSFFTTIFSYGRKTNLARIEHTDIPQVNFKNSINLGLLYDLQIFNYYIKCKPDCWYSPGTPKSNLKYFIHKKHVIQLYTKLDGLFSNIQKNKRVTYQEGLMLITHNISKTMLLGDSGCKYYVSKHLLFYLSDGLSSYNEIRLRVANLNKPYVLNDENTFYLRSGIKFKI
jgi:hypothetical protein